VAALRFFARLPERGWTPGQGIRFNGEMSTGSKIPSAGLVPASRASRGAELLAQAQIRRQRLAELPPEARPRTPEEGYHCQDLLIGQLLAHYGGQVIGYKIACTNKIAQDLLHMPEPFHGKMMSASCFDSPARIQPDGFFMRVIEAEFAFRIGRDEEPDAVLPGIEIVDSRFQDWTTAGAGSLIADNACHGAWIKGAPVTNWKELDLAAQEVRLMVNGTLMQQGSGAAVLGSPLNALRWLRESLHARGLALQPGEYVTTGVTTDIYMAQAGDRIAADFGPVGQVELAFDQVLLTGSCAAGSAIGSRGITIQQTI